MDQEGKWRLSPAYDISWCYNPQGAWTSKHQMSVNGKWDNITEQDMLNVAKNVNIKQPKQIIEQVAYAVSLWPKLAKEFGIPKEIIDLIKATMLWKIQTPFLNNRYCKKHRNLHQFTTLWSTSLWTGVFIGWFLSQNQTIRHLFYMNKKAFINSASSYGHSLRSGLRLCREVLFRRKIKCQSSSHLFNWKRVDRKHRSKALYYGSGIRNLVLQEFHLMTRLVSLQYPNFFLVFFIQLATPRHVTCWFSQCNKRGNLVESCHKLPLTYHVVVQPDKYGNVASGMINIFIYAALQRLSE